MDQEPYEKYMQRMHRETEMSLENRLVALKNKHHLLDKTIETLIAEHAPDLYISARKKEKLALKDEIAKVESELRNS